MPIQINNINAIDDNRNFSAAGITTIGSGSTAITINGSNSVVNIGTGITLSGSDGSISIAGTVYASSLNVPIQISSFSPANGAVDASPSNNIVLTFNQTVGLGTTGFIEVFVGTARSEFISVGSTRAFLSNGGTKLNIDPTNSFPGLSTVSLVMSNGFVTANGSNFSGINTVGSSVTSYSFRSSVSLGDAFGGGTLICQSGGVRWIASQLSSEVTRTWYCRADASTRAQVVSGCTGWFVPDNGQVSNPGYICRAYWTYSNTCYWSDTTFIDNFGAWFINMTTGEVKERLVPGGGTFSKTNTLCVRSFRCVTY